MKAENIYQRIEMTENGEAGNVWNDLEEILEEGDFQEFEDYFGDLDPFEFL